MVRSFQASSGSSTKGSPAGVVIERKCWSTVAMRCVRSRPARATSEASVEAGEGMTARDEQGLVERVGPPADEVGAGVEVLPQRLAGLGRRGGRRGSPSRPPRAAWPRGPRRACDPVGDRLGDRGRPRRRAATTTLVSRTTVNPRRTPPSSCPSRAARSGRRCCERRRRAAWPGAASARPRPACGG